MSTFFKIAVASAVLAAAGYGCYSAGWYDGDSAGFSSGRKGHKEALAAMNKAAYERNVAQFEVEWLREQLDRAPRLTRKEVRDDLRAIRYSVPSEEVRSAAVDSYISDLNATEEHALRSARNLFESAVEELRLEKNNGVGYLWVANPISAKIAEEPVAELLGWAKEGSRNERVRAAMLNGLAACVRYRAIMARWSTPRSFGIIDPNRPE
jgi:hypothetical protein